MARRSRSAPYASAPPQLEVSSLIDVCFLLLIYFLATSTLVPKERDLQMQLPVPQPDRFREMEIRPLFIGVQSDGSIYTGLGNGMMMLDPSGSDRTLPLLDSHLALYASASRGPDAELLVQIHVHGNASQQRVVDVLNALAKAHIHKVTFTDLVEM